MRQAASEAKKAARRANKQQKRAPSVFARQAETEACEAEAQREGAQRATAQAAALEEAREASKATTPQGDGVD